MMVTIMMMMMTKIHCSSAECDVLAAVFNDDYSFARCKPKTVDGGSVRCVCLGTENCVLWRYEEASKE
jgi:hypothetical protein